MPPLAMMIPDNTNIGTARRGKLSRPPSMERTTNVPLAVNEGSKVPGSTDAIPREMETGIAITRQITKIINTTTAGMYYSFLHTVFHSITHLCRILTAARRKPARGAACTRYMGMPRAGLVCPVAMAK